MSRSHDNVHVWAGELRPQRLHGTRGREALQPGGPSGQGPRGLRGGPGEARREEGGHFGRMFFLSLT